MVKGWKYANVVVQADCEALNQSHLQRHHDIAKPEWLDAVATDQTITGSILERAIQFAREWH